MPKFSIVTPVWNRLADGKLKRCLNSTSIQTFADFEHVVVDDGSTDGDVEALVKSYGSRYVYTKIKHQGRVIARNAGMVQATGEWICWLDSDDAYDCEYLHTFAYHIEKEPDAMLWVCGVVVHGVLKVDGKHMVPSWTQIRAAWMPPVSCDGCHTLFTSGHVGTGMFVFNRKCLDTVGYMPDWLNHNQVADGIDEWLELPLGTTGYSSAKRLVGNPWGDDFCLHQKLSLHFRNHLINAALYVQYIR